MDNPKPTILIVDDERFFINILVDLLKPKYRTVIALNGEQAIDRTLSDTPPDLILLDIVMPGMDGYEVCHRLKQNSVSQDIPIIFLTSRNEVGAETKGFNLGAIDYITKPISPPTVLARVNTHLTLERTLAELNNYNRQLEQTVTARTHDLTQEIIDRKKAEEQLYRLANYDQVTGLPTERLFKEQLAQSLKQARRNDTAISLVAIDVDHFNQLEKSLGPALGRQLFVQLTTRLASSVRETDTLGRINSGKFALALMESTEKTASEVVNQKIRVALNKPFIIDNNQINGIAFIGVALFPRDAENIDDLIKHAEWAAYHAKSKSPDTIHFYSGRPKEKMLEQTNFASELRRAIEHNELNLCFQPILESCSNRVYSVEIVPQWQTKQDDLLLPERFIPVAEENGLVQEMSLWILTTAFCKFQNLLKQHNIELNLHLKIHSKKFFYSNDFVPTIETALKTSAVYPNKITLAVSESILIEAPSESIYKFTKLKDLDLKLSIDDFGIGYSSVAFIHKFPVDSLKLHRSVISGNLDGTGDKVLIEAIIAMAHTLGFGVVASGVESENQRTLLTTLNCEFLQGQLIGNPVLEEEFLAAYA